MGHLSGFRRGGRDLTRHFEGGRPHPSKASQAYEARLERRQKGHERQQSVGEERDDES
jgi:hypothetical protein